MIEFLCGTALGLVPVAYLYVQARRGVLFDQIAEASGYIRKDSIKVLSSSGTTWNGYDLPRPLAREHHPLSNYKVPPPASEDRVETPPFKMKYFKETGNPITHMADAIMQNIDLNIEDWYVFPEGGDKYTRNNVSHLGVVNKDQTIKVLRRYGRDDCYINDCLIASTIFTSILRHANSAKTAAATEKSKELIKKDLDNLLRKNKSIVVEKIRSEQQNAALDECIAELNKMEASKKHDTLEDFYAAPSTRTSSHSDWIGATLYGSPISKVELWHSEDKVTVTTQNGKEYNFNQDKWFNLQMMDIKKPVVKNELDWIRGRTLSIYPTNDGRDMYKLVDINTKDSITMTRESVEDNYTLILCALKGMDTMPKGIKRPGSVFDDIL